MNKIFSILILIALVPLFGIIALLILIDDGFPVFFRQKRMGINNSQFIFYKFRTMKKNTPNVATHLLTENLKYFTRCGLFLRKYSIDEFPQLINIIKGDMNFIGPRPSLFNQNDLIKLRTNCGVHKILPGITGYAQVNGRDQIEIKKKVSLDKFYLENKSLLLDIKILVLTFTKVLKADDVTH
jgi:O-antigen biosynthesis protein WbqP